MKNTDITIYVTASDDDISQRIRRIFKETKIRVLDIAFTQLLKETETRVSDIIIVTSDVLQNHRKKWNSLLRLISVSMSQLLIFSHPDHIDKILALQGFEAVTYIKLPVRDPELKFIIQSAYSNSRNLQDAAFDGVFHTKSFGRLIGKSDAMQVVYQQIRKAASTDLILLISGETGTGKDLAALTIHELSGRSKENFIPVNLAALPRELIASELFGYDKGAFTGATDSHPGKFEQANEGTVFLDEIGSVDSKMQVSLLRLLEHQEFYRLGGKKPVTNKSRILAATNEDLETKVKDGTFRQDLLYRLDVFRIHMPPLRERVEDIPMLVYHFMKQVNQDLQLKVQNISQEAMNLLQSYRWSGNVRELVNVIQRAMIMCDSNKIEKRHLPEKFQSGDIQIPLIQVQVGTPLVEIEKRIVLRTLEITNNNRTKASELLGISRRAIYNKIEKHNIPE